MHYVEKSFSFFEFENSKVVLCVYVTLEIGTIPFLLVLDPSQGKA